jgi:hypothetical protein
MNTNQIIATIDEEIAKLQRARELLFPTDDPTKRKRGRPAKKATANAPRETRKLSAAGRKRISDAMKARWAARKAPKKAVKS